MRPRTSCSMCKLLRLLGLRRSRLDGLPCHAHRGDPGRLVPPHPESPAEEETAVALPRGEFGLDVIALIGALLSTGRSVDVPFVQDVELQQGTITQARLYVDSMTLLQQ